MTHSATRAWFCAAIALLTASIANPLVESASNAGLFGSARYTDHSQIDLPPTLFVGALFLLRCLFLRVRALLGRRNAPRRHWLQTSGDALDGKVLARLLPCVFALQIIALYVMETVEQIAVFGHPLGGSVWLGGPVLVSLAAHALLCAITIAAAGKMLRAFAQTALRIVAFIREIASLAVGGSDAAFALPRRSLSRPYNAPTLCRIGERAPPFLVA
jgi:hypothetical protein